MKIRDSLLWVIFVSAVSVVSLPPACAAESSQLAAGPSTSTKYPVGMEFEVLFPAFTSRLTLISETQLHFAVTSGPSATVEIQVIPVREGVFAVSWQEADGTTVMNVQDFSKGVVHTYATMPDHKFLRMTGPIKVLRAANGAD